jgi:hypothetical protein
MQVPQAQAVNALLLRTDTTHIDQSRESLRRHAGHSVRGALARVAAIFDRRAHADAAVPERFAGQRWCDSTERQLNNELMHNRSTRL